MSRPTYDQLKAKYDLGVKAEKPVPKPAPTWDEIHAFYAANPDRVKYLTRTREEGER